FQSLSAAGFGRGTAGSDCIPEVCAGGSMFAGVRYAFRPFRKSPGVAVTAVLTLALGIGATTAIFTMFDQVLLRMLPVEKPKELVRLEWHGSFSGSMSVFGGDVGDYFSYPMYRDLRERNQVFSGVLATM